MRPAENPLPADGAPGAILPPFRQAAADWHAACPSDLAMFSLRLLCLSLCVSPTLAPVCQAAHHAITLPPVRVAFVEPTTDTARASSVSRASSASSASASDVAAVPTLASVLNDEALADYREAHDLARQAAIACDDCESLPSDVTCPESIATVRLKRTETAIDRKQAQRAARLTRHLFPTLAPPATTPAMPSPRETTPQARRTYVLLTVPQPDDRPLRRLVSASNLPATLADAASLNGHYLKWVRSTEDAAQRLHQLDRRLARLDAAAHQAHRTLAQSWHQERLVRLEASEAPLGQLVAQRRRVDDIASHRSPALASLAASSSRPTANTGWQLRQRAAAADAIAAERAAAGDDWFAGEAAALRAAADRVDARYRQSQAETQLARHLTANPLTANPLTTGHLTTESPAAFSLDTLRQGLATSDLLAHAMERLQTDHTQLVQRRRAIADLLAQGYASPAELADIDRDLQRVGRELDAAHADVVLARLLIIE